MGRRHEQVGLACAIAIVVVYAAINLDATPLWGDEGYTLGAVNRLGDSLSGTYGTMGLYYVFMWAWALVSTATWWLRLPSVLFAIATLVVLRPVARRVGGSSLAALALPVAALGPMFLWKATEARAYSLETLITTVCWYVVLRGTDAADRDDDRSAARWYLALVPLAVAGVFSHGLFLVQLVPIGLVVLLGPKPTRAVKWVAPSVISATVVVVVLREMGAKSVGISAAGSPGAVIGSTVSGFLSPHGVLALFLVLTCTVGGIMCVQRVRLESRSARRVVAAVPLAWALVPCVALAMVRVVQHLFDPRYLAPIGPGLALLLATPVVAADARVGAWLEAKTSRRTPGLGLASVAMVLLLAVALLTAPPPVDDDWRAAARIVATDARPGDAIIFANYSRNELVQVRVPFEAAWREVPHDVQPDVISPPRPLGEVRRFDDPLSEDEMIRAAERYDRVWVIGTGVPGRDTAGDLADTLVAATDLEEVDARSLSTTIRLRLLERT